RIEKIADILFRTPLWTRPVVIFSAEARIKEAARELEKAYEKRGKRAEVRTRYYRRKRGGSRYGLIECWI
ncbi:MAG: hypothetical protein D6679_07285, partial [Candidatus Hydrogenedentota bacterium]